MKQLTCLFFTVFLIFALTCCQDTINDSDTESSTETTSLVYDKNYSPEDMIVYFNEVVLNSEYYTGEGNYNAVQKWTCPIYYSIEGNATSEDMEVLTGLFHELNKINGFPGIHPADETHPNNLSIFFYEKEDFIHNMGEIIHYEEAEGAVEYWYYDDTNEIYKADIGYRTDIDQKTRNSVLLEEIINSLGITDTELREDSIVFSYSDNALALTDIDWLIVKLLYHPDMQCGMTEKECSEVILSLLSMKK